MPAASDLAEIFKRVAVEFGLVDLDDVTPPTKTHVTVWANMTITQLITLLMPQELEVGQLTVGRLDLLTKLQIQATDTSDNGMSPHGYISRPSSSETICPFLEVNVNGYPASKLSYRDFLKAKADTLFDPTLTRPVYSLEHNLIYYHPVNEGTLDDVNTIIMKFLELPTAMAASTNEVFPIDKAVFNTAMKGILFRAHVQAKNAIKAGEYLNGYLEDIFGNPQKNLAGLIGTSQAVTMKETV
jgi:hypothetical protein